MCWFEFRDHTSARLNFNFQPLNQASILSTVWSGLNSSQILQLAPVKRADCLLAVEEALAFLLKIRHEWKWPSKIVGQSWVNMGNKHQHCQHGLASVRARSILTSKTTAIIKTVFLWTLLRCRRVMHLHTFAIKYCLCDWKALSVEDCSCSSSLRNQPLISIVKNTAAARWQWRCSETDNQTKRPKWSLHETQAFGRFAQIFIPKS